ncbi:MAG: type II secretion system protein GspC [bacterium]|nr:type II secretion system protein GspC [bacterium]MDT8365068.1 type II secretion system protein GspC [bacterium]
MDQVKTYRYLFTLADLVLLVVAGFVASRIILATLMPPVALLPFTKVEMKATSAVNRGIQEPDAAVIVQRNLFGSKVLNTASPAAEKTEADMEGLPESTLPLKLLGTAVQVNGKRSFAIIQDTGTREEQIHFVGDEIREGTVITSVARNRVVLLRNGLEEILEKDDDQSAAAPQSSRTRPARAQRTPTVAEGSEPVTVRKVGDNNFVMDRREVEGVLQDFNKLLTQIRVVPHFADGKPDGFKIFNIRPGSLFASLGMVNGDIIKRVNGLDITGPEQALQMFQQLRDESQVTVDLERFRKNLTLQYEIR